MPRLFLEPMLPSSIGGVRLMCFSAPASFIVGATLIAAGVATFQRAQSWREMPLGAVPLLFAGQQFVEGVLWLRLESGTDEAAIAWLANCVSCSSLRSCGQCLCRSPHCWS